jgi:hypothetical protein
MTSDFLNSIKVLLDVLQSLVSENALVNISSYQQLTQFHYTFFTTVTHKLCWVQVNPDTTDELDEHIYGKIPSFLCNSQQKKKKTHCSVLYLTLVQHIMTAHI